MISLTNLGLRAGQLPGNWRFSMVAASAAETSNTFGMRPGVVVDLAAERLYMMNPQGGIDAVELASGNLLWTTKAAAKPLAVFGDRLAAQADQTRASSALPIVLLDTKNGGRVVVTITLPISASMTPSINNGMGSSSSVDARVDHDGLLVWWTVTSRGVSPIPGPVSARTDTGAALINLQSYQAVTLAPDQAAARIRGNTSAAKQPKLNGNEVLYFAPQLADGYFVSVKPDAAGAEQHAVLKRWSAVSGEPLPDVELGPGYIASLLSADRSLYLVVSKASTTEPGYLWSLYAIGSGERIAEVRLPESGRPFFVWHSILICEAAPAGLRALDLKTGTEIWKRALRDTSYHGPYPAQL